MIGTACCESDSRMETESQMVWLDYNIIRNSDPIQRRNSAESALNQRRFSIFGYGSDSAPNQR